MGVVEGEDQQTPLLDDDNNFEEKPFLRTGTIWTAVAHIITGVIGAGVLSLAWSVAQLGWIAGPLSIIVFAGITFVSSQILCDCFRSSDPQYGPSRNRSYLQAVNFYLGERSKVVCGVLCQESLFGTGIAYVITSANALRHNVMGRLRPHGPSQRPINRSRKPGPSIEDPI